LPSKARNPNKVPRNWKDAKALEPLEGWSQFAELGPIRILHGDPAWVQETIIRITGDVKPLVVSLPCGRIQSSQELFVAAKEKLRFPDHFAMNWDGFKDCILSYDFISESHIVVMFTGFKAFCENARWEALMLLKTCRQKEEEEEAKAENEKQIVYVFVDA
jgi:hypothetical protein